MIKLLIVDDEEEIRCGIKDMIDWESNGISVCGGVSNGVEALKFIETDSPDILIIDIRMPVMNGLEVIEAINNRSLNIKSIVLSGYDDFSYAQKALKLGAMDYLLKPCRPRDILDAVLKIKSSIEAEKVEKENRSKLKLQFNESLPMLKEKYLIKLISPERKRPERLPEDFTQLKLNLDTTMFMVLIIRIDNFSSFCEDKSSKDVELMKFAVKNIAEEILVENFKCEAFENNDDIVVIANIGSSSSQEILPSLLESIGKNVKEFLGFSISTGMGRQYKDINSIHHSYDEALKAINAGFFLGPESIIKYEDVYDRYAEEAIYPINEEKEILKCIKSGNSEGLESLLDDFFSALSREKLSKDHLIKSGTALALSLHHLCIEINVDSNDSFGQGFTFLDEIRKLDTLWQLKSRIARIAMGIMEGVNNKKGSNRIIDSAMKFIEENYYKDLNLDTVAKSVFITSGYLSLLFKQVMGINFVDYLHRVRIDKACEILKDIRLKSYEVAFKVGYSDEKYFAQIFKKHTGMTPTQYRENTVT